MTDVDKKMASGVIACIAILRSWSSSLLSSAPWPSADSPSSVALRILSNNEAASLEFKNAGYTLNKDGLDILKSISGSAPTGAVLAVMCPSGARKSTLVYIMAGKNSGGKVTGQTLLNGKQVHLSEIRRAVGYVDQEDIMPPAQTVYEAACLVLVQDAFSRGDAYPPRPRASCRGNRDAWTNSLQQPQDWQCHDPWNLGERRAVSRLPWN